MTRCARPTWGCDRPVLMSGNKQRNRRTVCLQNAAEMNETKRTMIYITHVCFDAESPVEHQHITDVRWWGPSETATNESSLEQVVDWINDGGDAWSGKVSRTSKLS